MCSLTHCLDEESKISINWFFVCCFESSFRRSYELASDKWLSYDSSARKYFAFLIHNNKLLDIPLTLSCGSSLQVLVRLANESMTFVECWEHDELRSSVAKYSYRSFKNIFAFIPNSLAHVMQHLVEPRQWRSQQSKKSNKSILLLLVLDENVWIHSLMASHFKFIRGEWRISIVF